MSSASDVDAAERRYVQWWGRRQLPVTAIVTGVLMPPVLIWIAVDRALPWLLLFIAACPALEAYGVWGLRRLGPRPTEATDDRPHGAIRR